MIRTRPPNSALADQRGTPQLLRLGMAKRRETDVYELKALGRLRRPARKIARTGGRMALHDKRLSAKEFLGFAVLAVADERLVRVAAWVGAS
jgi:hypothetical protein